MDPDTPTVARMYDYWLGGKDNFAADREMAERATSFLPEIPRVARANRDFVVRAVRFLAERGVRQYIDLGTGLPTSPNVHEIAREVQPAARTAYVDIDSMVVTHSRAMAAGAGDGIATVHADLREPAAVLGDPAVQDVIDFSEPVAVLMIAVLHYLSHDDDVPALLGRYRDSLARGSYLAVSVGLDAGLDDRARRRAQALFGRTALPARSWTRPEVTDMLACVEPVRPGIVAITDWRAAGPRLDVQVLGAVGAFRHEPAAT